ncbi:MAG: hypothetical protein K1X86_07965 [Ignavibacteria bacterium]|nr:hypothetical protein [Ignavibacteria bacterium]
MKNGRIKNNFQITETFIRNLDPAFAKKLKNKFSGLNDYEINLCILRRNDFNSYECAQFMMQTEKEINKAIKKIRKKILCNNKIILKKYLNKLMEEK